MLPVAILLSAATLAAQTLDQSLTVSATRVVTLPPELTAVELTVAADPAMTMSAVIEALAGIGVKADYLVSASASGNASSGPQQFGGQRSDSTYSFQWTAPAANFRDILGQIDAARRQLPQGITTLQHNVYLSSSQAAFAAAREAALPELFAELRTRAENLAKITGANLGALLSLIDLSSPASGASSIGLPLPGTRVSVGLTARFAR